VTLEQTLLEQKEMRSVLGAAISDVKDSSCYFLFPFQASEFWTNYILAEKWLSSAVFPGICQRQKAKR
jgi:hypothetical protein